MAKKKANVFSNLNQDRTELQYNNNSPLRYGIQYETDVLLHTSNKSLMRQILENMESDSVKIYFNDEAKPFRV